MLFEMVAGVFEQIAVEHAARTNRFASTAAETGINMAHRGISHLEPAILHRPHQINPPARRFIFVGGLQISGARAKAQPAVNAGERFLFIEKALRAAWE